MYWRPFLLCGLMQAAAAALDFLGPALLGKFIQLASSDDDSPQLAVLCVVGLTLGRAVSAVLQQHQQFLVSRLGLRVSGALKTAVYVKLLRLSAEQRQARSSGDVMNLLTVDVQRLVGAAGGMWSALVLPSQIVVAMVLLWDVMGASMLAGLLSILVVLAANYQIAHYQKVITEQVMAQKDERMKATTEMLNAMRQIKLAAEELRFRDRILALREVEVRLIWEQLLLGALNIFLLWMAPLLISVSSFAAYTLYARRSMAPSAVFTALALFRLLQEPLRALPGFAMQLVQAAVSLKRLREFLAAQDLAVVLQAEKLGRVDIPARVAGASGERREGGGQEEVVDSERYAAVVWACELGEDLRELPAGDRTEIGEKGVTLSGGQKWRVALARAAYSTAGILVLDDPLSALDARVSARVYDKLIVRFLRKRTRLVSTNQLEHALSRHVDSVIILDPAAKRVRQIPGRRKGASCAEIVDALRSCALSPPESLVQKMLEEERQSEGAQETSESETESESERERERGRERGGKHEFEGEGSGGGRECLVAEEERETGKVSLKVYLKYLEAVGGWWVLGVLLGIQTSWQVLQVASDLWLSSWSQQSEEEQRVPGAQQRSLLVYALLCLGAALMVLARTLIVSSRGLWGARALFLWQTEAVIRAPIRFFDSTPVGRILNRATEDQNSVDTQLCFAFGSLLAQSFGLVGQLVTTAAITRYLLIPVAPMLWMYCKITAVYLETSRELQRIQSIAKSPLLSHVNASVAGAATVRAFGAAARARFVMRFVALLDLQQQAVFAGTAATQWFSVRLRLMGVAVLLFTTALVMVLRNSLPPGLIGLAISYALVMEDVLSGLVFYWQWIETSMVAPERILQYVDIEPEAALHDTGGGIQTPLPDWPQHGCIEFDAVRMSYAPQLPPVLKDLTFRTEAGWMVGVVGRTGAGKSSIAAALFRLVELTAGAIRIDGVNIASVGLHTLRGRLAIVAQHPVLFAGPLLAYLDPFGVHSEQEVWQALGLVNLKHTFAAKPLGLLHRLAEDGANLSQGQRQLVCLARVLLCQAKVVVMDEATAAMDDETDSIVQSTVRNNFKHSTLLVIAHRIKTILDSHQIIVMHNGACVEQGPPRTLLQSRDSVFSKLAGEMGAHQDDLQAAAAAATELQQMADSPSACGQARAGARIVDVPPISL